MAVAAAAQTLLVALRPEVVLLIKVLVEVLDQMTLLHQLTDQVVVVEQAQQARADSLNQLQVPAARVSLLLLQVHPFITQAVAQAVVAIQRLQLARVEMAAAVKDQAQELVEMVRLTLAVVVVVDLREHLHSAAMVDRE
jgi:hypothetical protein